MVFDLIRSLRNTNLLPLIHENSSLYNNHWNSNDILNWQLDSFNQNWQNTQKNVPYFLNLVQNHSLPKYFSSWQEFKELVPVMTRKTIQNNYQQLIDTSKEADLFLTTGGSTSEPISLPSWNLESTYDQANRWYARSWYNVNPSDKLFLIWGHSHLLGSGISGWINAKKRLVKDKLLGYYRFSAYNLTEESLEKAGRDLIEFKPHYVLAYSGVLDRFARINAHKRSEFHKLKLKVAIGTSELFPKTDSIDVISDILGCPVVMEYGAVETGNIAHQTKEGKFFVFWRNYLIEGRECEHDKHQYDILLTTLYPRCFPLIRYEIGDILVKENSNSLFIQEFNQVIGRSNDFITLDNQSLVYIATSAFMQAIKGIQSITDYQIIQSKNNQIKLNYISSSPLQSNQIGEIKRRLKGINPRLEHTIIERVDFLQTTIAGKISRLIKE